MNISAYTINIELQNMKSKALPITKNKIPNIYKYNTTYNIYSLFSIIIHGNK